MRRMSLFGLGGIVVLLGMGTALVTRGRAQTSQDGPSFQDTAKYLTSFLATHGCTNGTQSLRNGTSNMLQNCTELTNPDSCVIKYTRVNRMFDDGEWFEVRPRFEIDLSTLDPSSLRIGPVNRDNPPFVTYPNPGLEVDATVTSGNGGLSFTVDNSENATHIINALSHAITLCGGKKAAF
jgi:hypothetical protein